MTAWRAENYPRDMLTPDAPNLQVAMFGFHHIYPPRVKFIFRNLEIIHSRYIL